MRKRKLLAFAAALALMLAAALPAWAAEPGQADKPPADKPPIESQVYVKDGILYAIYHPFSLPVRVLIPAAAPVEGQMVIHRNHRATFRRISAGGEYVFDFPGQACWEYALLIVRTPVETQVSYVVGPIKGALKIPATAGHLRISWPELKVTRVGTRVGSFAYSLSGSLKAIKISEETTPDGARVERYRYWPAEGELLEGSLMLTLVQPEPTLDRPEPNVKISFTFPFCSGCVPGWLAGSSPVSTTPTPGPTPGGSPGPTPTPEPGGSGFGRFWPGGLAAAAGAALALGWVLPRRVVDVWLSAAEGGKVLVQRGRRGPRRVRAVLSFTGAEDVCREVVLGRGETRQVEVPVGWQVVEVTTPGRRNRGQPTRLEREAAQDVAQQT